MTHPTPQRLIQPWAFWTLISAAALETLLAVYQWVELVHVLGGGQAACTINETVNCEAWWLSDFARSVHHATGLPIAALGLAWGLTALTLLVLLARRGTSAATTTAVQLWSLLGVAVCVALAVQGFGRGSVCLTCVSTYLLTAVFAATAMRGLPIGRPSLSMAGRALLVLVPSSAAGLLAVTVVNARVASSTTIPDIALPTSQAVHADAGTNDDAAVAFRALAKSLTAEQRRHVRDGRDQWLLSPERKVDAFPKRQVWGDANAPVHIVEFTDVRCPHCRALVENLERLKSSVPAGWFTLEPRYFPLDHECNPHVQGTPGDGVRCAGALAQICLEQSPDYWRVRAKLFEVQESLTVPGIFEIASSPTLTREALATCIADPSTTAKLNDDIQYAATYEAQGTPLVLVNGRAVAPFPAFLFAFIVAQGDVRSKTFAEFAGEPAE